MPCGMWFGVPVTDANAGGRSALAASAAFTAFGIFFGFWGAGLPQLQSGAGLTPEQFGIGLLFVGVGSLPGMALAGRLVDRYGVRVAPYLVTGLALVGLGTAQWALSLPAVIGWLTAVGFMAGAGDVAINTLAGLAEQQVGSAVLTRSHGMFSLGVMLGSLLCGALFGVGLGYFGAFAVAVILVAVLSWLSWRWAAFVRSAPKAAGGGAERVRWGKAWPLLLVGLVAILPYASENAHQSWGAIFMTGLFGASPFLASMAPATFAGAAMVARFAIAPWSLIHPRLILIVGGAVSAAGALVVAVSPGPYWALLGFAIAALGAATLVPVMLSYTLADVPAEQRGRGTSLITTTAYLGFLLGPPFVGAIVQAVGLRGAMVAVSALMAVFVVLVIPVTTVARNALRR